MAQPVQINNESDEMVEISAAEYKAVMEFSVAISEQNAATEAQNIATQQSVQALTEALRIQGENQAAMFAALVDAIRAINITVNVPEMPAPVVNMPAPKVTVQTPAEKKRTGKVKFTRNNNGAITGADITTE